MKTNIYPLLVQNRNVYRYDVRMYTSRLGSQERIVDLCKGDRDELVIYRYLEICSKCLVASFLEIFSAALEILITIILILRNSHPSDFSLIHF